MAIPFPPFVRRGFVALGLLFTVLLVAIAQADPNDPRVSDSPADGLKVVAPGVRVDWKNLAVELDARVVLREGPLELLACSPRTREHESILVVLGRPLHIFQALGLIGMDPGSPARYDEESQSWSPPRGTPLRISIRYDVNGEMQEVPVENWLSDAKTKKSPKSVGWVFAGSRNYESGRFGADVDGTVISVVDFDTALVSISELHSADNELLWVTANTEAIPPIGTRCALRIADLDDTDSDDSTFVIDIVSVGVLHRNGKPISPGQVAVMVRTGKKVIVRVSTALPTKSLNNGLKALDRAGIDRKVLEIRHVDDTSSGRKSSKDNGG